MSTISQSFFHLVYSNNGYFKSEKQAKYLLDHCQEDHSFTCSGEVYGNPYRFFFICDNHGIKNVEKHTGKKVDIWWEREADHEAFLIRKEEYNAKYKEHLKKVHWMNKARRIVNQFKSESTDKFIKLLMKDKNNTDHLAKICKLNDHWKNKMTKLEKKVDELEFGENK